MIERILCLMAIVVSTTLVAVCMAGLVRDVGRDTSAGRITTQEMARALEGKARLCNSYQDALRQRHVEFARLATEIEGLKPELDTYSATRTSHTQEAAEALAAGRVHVQVVRALDARLRIETAQTGPLAGASERLSEAFFTEIENKAVDELRRTLGLDPDEDAWRRLRFQLWSQKQRVIVLNGHSRKTPRLHARSAAYQKALGEIKKAAARKIKLMLGDDVQFRKYESWRKVAVSQLSWL